MLSEHFQRRHEYNQLHAEQKKMLTDQENSFLREVEKKHREEIVELTKKSDEKEVVSIFYRSFKCRSFAEPFQAEEEAYRLQEDKLKQFYNTEENSYGNITPYSSKIVDEKKYVEALC